MKPVATVAVLPVAEWLAELEVVPTTSAEVTIFDIVVTVVEVISESTFYKGARCLDLQVCAHTGANT